MLSDRTSPASPVAARVGDGAGDPLTGCIGAQQQRRAVRGTRLTENTLPKRARLRLSGTGPNDGAKGQLGNLFGLRHSLEHQIDIPLLPACLTR